MAKPVQACPECSAEVREGWRACPFCAAPLGELSRASTVSMPAKYGQTSSDSLDEGRFPVGTTLSERYRILGLLGRGGMGEVYRANDLKLGQPVALKFLLESSAGNRERIARFHAEVRIARQVSHPNVCRVYDIGEVDGSVFLSMEYIDGEDLRSLLRRIGRLPGDKALEIARGLCSGLSAAHAKGVLHRDLKPANIMLDGRGHVLITDFGLAAMADQLNDGRVREGTPAYMAPEQLAGREVSVRSDIYSLGLILHEMFTGKRPDEVASNPTSTVKDLDPVVERLILQCLQVEPRNRPSSAIAVARALPGGDPFLRTSWQCHTGPRRPIRSSDNRPATARKPQWPAGIGLEGNSCFRSGKAPVQTRFLWDPDASAIPIRCGLDRNRPIRDKLHRFDTGSPQFPEDLCSFR